MRRTMRTAPSALVLPLLLAALPAGAGEYRPGWTPTAIEEAATACTEALVQGAWENTKREQNVDPKKPLTPEIRKQLAPQIKALERLCDCTVKETAKKYGQEDYEKKPDEVQRYTLDLVKRGVCKAP
jgi:hypothetical protein